MEELKLTYVELVFIAPSQVASLPSKRATLVMEPAQALKFLSEQLAAQQPAAQPGDGGQDG